MKLSVFQKRRLARFLALLEPIVTLSSLLVMFVFFCQFVPNETFNAEPSTGGDTGSHFWTLYGLFEHGLPNWTVRVWNPGNHAGEPRLLHYFPLPFLVMAAMAEMMPLGTAFNIGCILGTAVFPFAVYFALRGLRTPFPVPLLGAAVAHLAHYNESYSMWGGNTLSTLAGQFAHSYALALLLFGVGALGWEIRKERVPLFSSIFFSCVFLSHGYPALGIPAFLLAMLLFFPYGSFRSRFKACTISGLFSILLSCWFLVPMKLNGAWQTRHDLHWFSDRLFEDTFPPQLIMLVVGFQVLFAVTLLVWFLRRRSALRAWATGLLLLLAGVSNALVYAVYSLRQKVPVPAPLPEPDAPPSTMLITRFQQLTFLPSQFVPLVIAVLLSGVVLSCLYLAFKHRLHGKGGRLARMCMIWLIPSLWYVYLYYLLPFAELIDIRAVPQVHLFGCILIGVFTGYVLRYAGRIFNVLAVVPLVVVCLWATGLYTKNFPNWLRWNMSGWQAKELYPVVQQLSASIRGTFSDPRVIYELSDRAQATGTIRVWEMLPFFSGRATLESVYLEATLLSGEAVWLQAEASKQPSCPLPQFACPRYDLSASKPRMELMGVGGIILATNQTKTQAREASHLEEKGDFGPWTVFSFREPPPLVEVFRKKPELSPELNWRDTFYKWFTLFDGSQPYRISVERLDPKIRESLEQADGSTRDTWAGGESCHPTVEVNFSRIVLRTDCPGRAHLLKFNYHPAWKTSTGDSLFIVSPAFIGIIPSSNEVTLDFGYLPAWKYSSIISFGSLIFLLFASVAWRRKRVW